MTLNLASKEVGRIIPIVFNNLMHISINLKLHDNDHGSSPTFAVDIRML